MIYNLLIFLGTLIVGVVIGYYFGKRDEHTVMEALEARDLAIKDRDYHSHKIQEVMEHLAFRTYPCSRCGKDFHNYYEVIKGEELHPEYGLCDDCKNT